MSAPSFDEILNEVTQRLGNRTDISNRLTGWVQDAQNKLARCDIELTRLDATKTSKLVTGQSIYTMDKTTELNLQDLIGIYRIRNDTSNWLMRYFPWEEFRELHTQSDSSPTRWAREGDRIAFDPKPEKTYDITIDYRRGPTSTQIIVDESMRENLVLLTTSIGWTALQEHNLARANFSALPMWLQSRLQVYLGDNQWSMKESDDVGFKPEWLS